MLSESARPFEPLIAREKDSRGEEWMPCHVSRSHPGGIVDKCKLIINWKIVARIFQGLTQLPGKIVSIFEPHTEIIRKGGRATNGDSRLENGPVIQLHPAGAGRRTV
jgi:hypothetical protein